VWFGVDRWRSEWRETSPRRENVNVEHVAFLVDDPNAVAEWYCANLGMKVVRKGGPPAFGTFLADGDRTTMFEIYANPDIETPDYASLDPLILHLAFYADDLEGTREELIRAGATAAAEINVTDRGDKLAMLRDPWGLAVQLVNRREPIQ
jgi:catechol 2,3-dioxygenase-like lactoylglutathione lyase family enzyme